MKDGDTAVTEQRSEAGIQNKKERAARRQRARQRALRRLALYHTAEFERFLHEEFEIEGLTRVPQEVKQARSRFDD